MNVYLQQVDNTTNEITININSDFFVSLHTSMTTKFYNSNELYLTNGSCRNKFKYIINEFALYCVLADNAGAGRPSIIYDDLPEEYVINNLKIRMNSTKHKTATNILEQLGYINTTSNSKKIIELSDYSKNLISQIPQTQNYVAITFKISDKLMNIIQTNIKHLISNNLSTPTYRVYIQRLTMSNAPLITSTNTYDKELMNLYIEATNAYQVYAEKELKYRRAVETKLQQFNCKTGQLF